MSSPAPQAGATGAGAQTGPLFFCHECHTEIRPPNPSEPQCTNCQGFFVEEIPDESNPDENEDDPRAFDPEDDEAGGPGLEELLAAVAGGAGGAGGMPGGPPGGLAGGGLFPFLFGGQAPGQQAQGQGQQQGAQTGQQQQQQGGQQGGQGPAVSLRIFTTPGGGITFATTQLGEGAAGDGAGAAGQPASEATGAGPGGAGPGLGASLMSLLSALGGFGGAQRQQQPRPQSPGSHSGATPQPQSPGQQQQGPGQQGIPIQNLAQFLGEAFAQQPHPADDPANNPFAEGLHESTPQPETPGEQGAEGQQQQQQQGANAFGIPADHPLSSLFNLFGSLGMTPVGAGPGGASLFFSNVGGGGAPGGLNLGDFAWGEQGFQNILNDLMQQAAGRVGPTPAPDDVIDDLPSAKVTPDILDADTINDCPICRDSFELDEDLLKMPCTHVFHPDCLKPWLKTSGTCPVCRYALVPQPGDQPQTAAGQAQAQAGGSAADPTSPSATSQAPDVASPVSAREATPGPSTAPVRPSAVQSPSTSRIPHLTGSTLPGSFPLTPSRRATNDTDDDDPAEEELPRIRRGTPRPDNAGGGDPNDEEMPDVDELD